MTTPELVESRVKAISPHLHGLPPEIQGAILADLMAMWLAGHHVIAGGAMTDKLRKEVLRAHNTLVLELVPLNERLAAVAHALAAIKIPPGNHDRHRQCRS